MANKEAVTAWIQALRSGRFVQGTGVLVDIRDPESSKYCCLGVACHVAIENGVTVNVGVITDGFGHEYSRTFDDNEVTLPSSVMNWLGLDQSSPYVKTEAALPQSLAGLNDNGVSFDRIAEYIEKTYLGQWQ